jgi:hypothetical protein
MGFTSTFGSKRNKIAVCEPVKLIRQHGEESNAGPQVIPIAIPPQKPLPGKHRRKPEPPK